MRTVSSTLEAAITSAPSVSMLAKVIITPSRTFFNSLTYDQPYDAADYSIPTSTPTGQCAFYSGNQNKMITFVVDPSDGKIYGMEQNDATKNDLSLTANKDTKPAAFDLGNGTCYLWYWDDTNLRRCIVNLSTWGVSSNTIITIDYLPAGRTVVAGSPVAISATQIVFFYKTSIGGLGVGHYDGTRFWHWDGRFMSPNTITSTDWSIYTAAVLFNNRVFAYSTDVDIGEVRGVEYNGTKDQWTDSFTALPADLSRFDITNAISRNGYIHMAGQFHRTDDLVDAKVYCLLLRSKDGRTFSWDRFTLLSTLGFQFQVSPDQGTGQLYASDRNSVGVTDMSYFLHNDPNGKVTLQPPNDLVSATASNVNSMSLVVSSSKEVYYDHEVVKKGNRAEVYLGYKTSAGDEYILYGTYIIDSRSQGFRAGTRTMSLSLVDEGTWKINQIAFPFYSEILSKTSMYDDCDERDHTYAISTEGQTSFNTLIVDFWNNEEWDGDGGPSGTGWTFRSGSGPGAAVRTWAWGNGTDGLLKTLDLDKHPFITGNPVITTDTVIMSLYGWEQADASARPNTNFILYAVTAPADDLENRTATIGSLTSTYSKFPQDYIDTEAGSYPVVYEWTGLTEDHVLLYVGIVFDNADTGSDLSTGVFERLEIDGVDFAYSQVSSSASWSLENPDPDTYGQDFLKYPDTGLPSILFTTKPYTAFKFNAAASFIYVAGATPLTVGSTAWGVVGLAKNGSDYVVGRWKNQNTSLEILKVRGGVETVVASFSTSAPEDVMLDHRDGILQIWTRTSSTTWSGPRLIYHWDEVTEGVMSTSTTGIMHTGIYGAVAPPGFMSAGMNISDADAIPMLTGFPISTLADFPTSGTVVIDGAQYTYSQKVTSPTQIYGPYQARNTANYGTYTEGSDTFSGLAVEIGLYKPLSSPTLLAGLILASDNGHTWWPIINTDWDVSHASPLRNRSRHYAANINGNYVGWNQRMYMCWGLGGVEQVATSVGETLLHSYGSWVSLYATDALYARRILTTTMDADSTVKDMVRQLCRAASVETEFSGDWSENSQVVGTTPIQLATDVMLFPGGFDVHFTIPSLASAEYIKVYGDNIYIDDGETEKVEFQIKNNAGVLEIGSIPTGSTAAEYKEFTDISPLKSHNCRMLFHDVFCSVYIDNVWVATFAYDLIVWPTDAVDIYMKADSDHTVTDIVVTELFDWREAIYIESEMSAQSAIASIVQERPIELGPTVDGGLVFSYNIERDIVVYSNAVSKQIIRSHEEVDRTSGEAGSDAIVYSADIDFVSNQDFSDTDGFITRVLKLASLDHGAGTAARIILEKSYEDQNAHSIAMRPDPRLEMGDIMELHYLLPGTNRQVDVAIIVESLSIGLSEGVFEQRLTGRGDDAQPGSSTRSAYMEGA